MPHALDDYWTMTQFSEKLGVNLIRVIRLCEKLSIDTYRIGGATLAHRDNFEKLQKAIKEKLIRQGQRNDIKKAGEKKPTGSKIAKTR